MIYLLKRIDDCGWDEYDAKIVRAPSESEARVIANRETGDEGRIWTNEALVTAELVYPNGEAAELLGSFKAG